MKEWNKNEIDNYEGHLWMVLDGNGQATQLLFSEPSLAEKQKAVGGLIEYAPLARDAKMPVPTGKDTSRISQVVDVIVNEEGLMRGYTENTVATYAASNIPLSERNEDMGYLVGPAIVHVNMSADDKVISFAEFMSMVSGSYLTFMAYGIQHYCEEIVGEYE